MAKANRGETKKLREMGISASYASEILRGVRVPDLELTARIYRETGLKVGQFKARSPKIIAGVVRFFEEEPVMP